eukprot:4590946-Prymnesium_polylepis.2
MRVLSACSSQRPDVGGSIAALLCKRVCAALVLGSLPVTGTHAPPACRRVSTLEPRVARLPAEVASRLPA